MLIFSIRENKNDYSISRGTTLHSKTLLSKYREYIFHLNFIEFLLKMYADQ